MSLLKDGHFRKIYVESSRAVARSSTVAEKLFQTSVEHGVQIVPADLPDLYKHEATPVEKFVRRIVFATTELERDLIVQRLQDGIKRKMQTTRKRTQTGAPKVSGCASLLEIAKPTSRALTQLRAIAARRQSGNYGLRAMARDMSVALDLPRTMGHETARRICSQLAEQK
jgi:DNA invertase Pin-like site-specific DNA recombinase